MREIYCYAEFPMASSNCLREQHKIDIFRARAHISHICFIIYVNVHMLKLKPQITPHKIRHESDVLIYVAA